MTLKINMRLHRFADEPDAVEQKEFARWLLEVEEDRIHKLKDNIIQLLNNLILPSQNINDLIHFIYPNFSTHSNSQYLVERTILTPKNANVYTVNSIIMNQFSGELIEYFSADTIENQSDLTHQYPIEFLNSLTIVT